MTQEVATKQTTLSGMLAKYKAEIARALPRHVTPDRMLRIAMTSARKNPQLLECSPESFLGAVIQSAQLGLEPDTPLGHAYLLPYKNNKSGRMEVNFQPGYRGYMDLIYRTANHPILMPVAVYEGDIFSYERGLHPKLEHKPMPHNTEPKLTHVYCVATFPDGRKEFDVMTRQEVEARRQRSKAKGFSPWQTDYEAMALKTVIRRFVKFLPMSAELQTAIGLDDCAESGQSQHNEAILKESEPIHTKRERVQGKMSQEAGEFDNYDETTIRPEKD